MNNLIRLNKSLNEYRQLFFNGSIGISLTDVFILHSIEEKNYTVSNIAKCLSKDKSYIIRQLQNLTIKSLIFKNGTKYLLTNEGKVKYKKSIKLLKEYRKLKELRQTWNFIN